MPSRIGIWSSKRIVGFDEQIDTWHFDDADQRFQLVVFNGNAGTIGSIQNLVIH